MSKETYLEMSEQLGTKPEDGDIPTDFSELKKQSQLALSLFEYCTDKWDTMNGSYLGKDLSNIKFLLELLDIDKNEWLQVIELLNVIINIRIDSVNKKIKNRAKMAGAKK